MSHKIPIPPKPLLFEIYEQTRSVSKVARHFKTSNPTVRKWFKEYSIQTYSHRDAVVRDYELKKVQIPTREELQFLYENISISDIRKMYNIGQETFYDWLKLHGIERLPHGEKVSTVKQNIFSQKFSMTKEQIEKDYEETQCMGGLAEKYNCSMTTIKKLFWLHDIEARFAKSSVGQLQLATYIESLGFRVEPNDRKIIYPLELDIVVPEKKIAIEYCGIYFHSETWGNKEKNYHAKKQLLCKDQGYDLITVFESEWNCKKDIVKSILKAKLGVISRKIPARKTEFKEVLYTTIKPFEEENHIQGSVPAKKYYGLFYQGELVMSLTVGKSRFNKKYANEIIRMTTKKDTLVIGGISKLIKNIGLSDCITYADKRYGTGAGYETVGFTKLKDTEPNYFYFHKKDDDTLHSRYKFQKHKIPNVDQTKTEYENMLDRDYDRIWDCGNGVYYIK